MILLTRNQEGVRGAPSEEILKTLHLPESLGRAELQKKLTEFDSYLQPLGLQVRVNPLNDFWFVTFRQDVTEFVAQNPFGDKPRLPATLLATIICMVKFGNQVPISAVQEMRKKETVIEDLKQLKNLGYVEIEGDNVALTPLIGYQLDLINLFEAINETMLKKETKSLPNLSEFFLLRA